MLVLQNVGAIGGYTQGGGHSLAMSQYGLAADQLLEANLVLANGEQVLASPCENTDLYTSLRGGGGGTYGVITSAKIKAYPDAKVTAQTFSMTALSSDHIDEFMNAVAIMYEAFPSLIDGGLSGYGAWSAYNPPTTAGNSPARMIYNFGAFDATIAQVQELFAPTTTKLEGYNGTSVNITINYSTFNDYFEYYYATNGVNNAAESQGALVSRLLGKQHLSNRTGLRKMLNVTAGKPDEYIASTFGAVGGGAVLQAPDKFSGVNPAWRETYVMNLVAQGLSNTADYATVAAVHHDITYVKGAAMTELAPDTGAYMNEGDSQDPNYLLNFYGGALDHHQSVKAKYDPENVFYCPTCVGSQSWAIEPDGKLCKI